MTYLVSLISYIYNISWLPGVLYDNFILIILYGNFIFIILYGKFILIILYVKIDDKKWRLDQPLYTTATKADWGMVQSNGWCPSYNARVRHSTARAQHENMILPVLLFALAAVSWYYNNGGS